MLYPLSPHPGPPRLCCHPVNVPCVPSQTDCFNYVRFLQSYNSSHLYACGTYAFQPKCTYIVSGGPKTRGSPIPPALRGGPVPRGGI